jgi:hypothetical protein
MVHADMLAVDAAGGTINRLGTAGSRSKIHCVFGSSASQRSSCAADLKGRDSIHLPLSADHRLDPIALLGRIIYTPDLWAAARYHPADKNRARAAEFGREAFRILEWAAGHPALMPPVERVRRRARASAHRLDARYLLDGGQPAAAVRAWTRALALHPPTALARSNILASALLNLTGLGGRIYRAPAERPLSIRSMNIYLIAIRPIAPFVR